MIGENNKDISDARLVAYLDGELSQAERADIARALEGNAELRERLDFLDSGGRAFGQAFDLLLDAAPDDRLQAMFAELVNGEAARPDEAATAAAKTPPPGDEKVVPFPRKSAGAFRPLWQMAAAASLALTMFGAGIITAVLYNPNTGIQAPTDPTRNWMDAVASYVSLFSEQTLAGMPSDNASRRAGLERVSHALGVHLTHDKVAAIPSVDFKGTQLLQLEGKPIAQLAFLSETGKPVAICIIRTTKPAEPPSPDRRQGLNIIHWVANGYGFMVIGDVPKDDLTRISDAARARLS
jgi:anti-sigma factor RsiW